VLRVCLPAGGRPYSPFVDRGAFDRHDSAGTLAALLADLDAAHHTAAAVPDLTTEVRLGLAIAAIRQQIVQVGPALLMRLVQAGYRRPDQALAELRAVHTIAWQPLVALMPMLEPADGATAARAATAAARAVPGAPDRARALHAVGLAMPEPARTTVLAEALDAIDGHTEQYTDRPALADLGRGLPPALHERAAAMARSTQSVEHRAKNLFGLATTATPALFTELLALVRAHPTEWWGHDHLVRAAPLLPPHLLLEALGVATGITAPDQRAAAITAVAAHLTGESRDTAISAAITTALAIRDTHDRAAALTALAADLHPALLARTVELVAGLPAWHTPDGAFANLAPHASGAQLARLLEAAVDGPNARACAELAPAFEPAQRERALAGIRADRAPGRRALALAAMLPLLPQHRDELVAEALAAGVADGRAYELFPLAERLAPYLSPTQVPTLLAAIRHDGSPPETLYGTLAPHLPPTVLPGLLAGLVDDLAHWHRQAELRTATVDGLAPHLPDELLPAALAVVRTTADEQAAATALTALLTQATTATDADTAQILTRCAGPAPRLAAAWAETELAAYLPPADIAALAAEAYRLPDPDRRVWTLARLAPYLDDAARPPVVAEVIAGAAHVKDPAGLIERVVPFLAPQRRAEVIDTVLDRYGPVTPSHEALAVLPQYLWHDGPNQPRHDGLARLAQYLDPGQLAREIDRIADGYDDEDTAAVIVCLAPNLPDDLAPTALAVAERISDTTERTDAVLALLPRLDKPTALMAWKRQWQRADASHLHRTFALTRLARHAPPPERAAAHIAAAQPEAYGRRPYPRHLIPLLPYLPADLAAQIRAELLATARANPRPDSRVVDLVSLWQDLPDQRDTLLADATAAARGIADPDARRRALSYLAPHLPRDGLLDALDHFTAAPPDRDHAWGLAQLIGALPADLLGRAIDLATDPDWQSTHPLQAALGRAHDLWRADHSVPLLPLVRQVLANRNRTEYLELLPALTPILADLAGPDAVRSTAFTVADLQGWWP
jgi:hypothetical protein